MKKYQVDHIKDGQEIYYFLRYTEDMSIVIAPSKYLKHKTKSHRSPNTVRRIAYALCFYLEYLEENALTLDDVYQMKYDRQHVHFTDFLSWLKSGKHIREGKIACPGNSTCNSYLREVFGWLQFLELQEQTHGNLKVLESHVVTFSNAIGLKFSLARRSFLGYLTKDDEAGRSIERDAIETLLGACTNIRDKVLLLLLAETGFRIGELLGVRYGKDIDPSRCRIRVVYRDNNENGARAKNARKRWAVISEGTLRVLLLYLAKYRDILKKSGYLFINVSGKYAGSPLKVTAVYAMLRRLEEKTGITATPHMLRHYFANERRKSGWDVPMIAQALGHGKLETTNRYLNISDAELEDASNAYFDSTRKLIHAQDLL